MYSDDMSSTINNFQKALESFTETEKQWVLLQRTPDEIMKILADESILKEPGIQGLFRFIDEHNKQAAQKRASVTDK